ncbi:MAG: Com family DNA-binding transcriptional regulator [Burkholderiales bacterium]
MQDVRCGSCGKKLAVGAYQRLQIKCPRCGCLNDLRAGDTTQSPQPERPRASINGATHGKAIGAGQSPGKTGQGRTRR